MLQKIDSFALLMYLKIKFFFSNLKNEEDGMEIVQVVLIILVGVLAIVAIWKFMGDWLVDLWNRIANTSNDKITELNP